MSVLSEAEGKPHLTRVSTILFANPWTWDGTT